jgi:exopolysaccharide biosynthesis polyprenyl glycosylphosphotransferase
MPSARRESLLASIVDGPHARWAWPVGDFIAITIALFAAVKWPGGPISAGVAWPLLVMPPLAIALLYMRGMYAERLLPKVLDAMMPIGGALAIAVLGAALVDIYTGDDQMPPAVYVHLWVLSFLFIVVVRVAEVLSQRAARSRGLTGHPTLIVGAGHVGGRIGRRLEEQPEYGLRPVGFLDADPMGAEIVRETGVPVLGSPSDLARIAEMTGADHVVLAFSAQPDEQMIAIVRQCERIGLEVLLVPRLFDSVNHRARYEPLGGLPLQRLRSISPQGWQFMVKHAMDRAVAALLLALFAVPMALIAIAVKLGSPGPMLFRQQRVGRDGQRFDLLKFRSMRPELVPEFAPAIGKAPGGIEGTDRRTGVGRLLRSSSLDELPQLINVLRGQMSLVGPRPERPEFVELFLTDVDRYGDRHRVKSGITGWAQVHGFRGQTSLADRVEWDNFYIEHWSLGLDVKILTLTFVAIFRVAE